MNLPLDYNILEAQNPSEKQPLLILLHGYGSDKNDLFSFASEINQKFLVVSLQAPLALPWGGQAWYEITYSENAEKWTNIPQALDSRKLIIETIEEIKKQRNIGDVYLLGFSQGAILSYSLALNYPDMFSGILALSGYIEPQLIPENLPSEDFPPIFASHGAQDPVIPIDWARKSRDILISKNLDLQFKEYQMAHGINPECFADMTAWLAQKDLL